MQHLCLFSEIQTLLNIKLNLKKIQTKMNIVLVIYNSEYRKRDLFLTSRKLENFLEKVSQSCIHCQVSHASHWCLQCCNNRPHCVCVPRTLKAELKIIKHCFFLTKQKSFYNDTTAATICDKVVLLTLRFYLTYYSTVRLNRLNRSTH